MTELPKGWINVPLSQLGTWVGGGTPSTTRPEFWDGDIPWVSPKDMKTDKIDRAIDNITELAVANSAAAIVASGSILIVTRSGILAHTLPVAVNTVRVAINQDLKALTPLEGLSPNYIRLVLQAHGRAILKACVKDGTTVHSVKVPSLLAYQVPLPPIPEQDRIVARIEELFSELDASVESLTKARALLGLYRQSLLKAAFQGKLTADWRAANPDKLETPETLLSRIRKERETRYAKALEDWQTALSEWRNRGEKGRKPQKSEQLPEPKLVDGLSKLPAGWAAFSVGSLCKVVRGGSPRPAGDPKFYGGPIPFLKVADLTQVDGMHVKGFTHTITEAGLSKTRTTPPNTLLISNSGATLGVPKICGFETTFNDGVAAFLGLSTDELPFHYYFWEGKTAELRGLDQGAAQPNLNTSILSETVINVCGPMESNEVSNRLSAQLSQIDRMQTEVADSLTRIAALRQSILKRAFSGRLVPQDPSDEPASALLARLQFQTTANPTRRRGRA